jgi:hypothetical protein
MRGVSVLSHDACPWQFFQKEKSPVDDVEQKTAKGLTSYCT